MPASGDDGHARHHERSEGISSMESTILAAGMCI
jgi:hypothetical protein